MIFTHRKAYSVLAALAVCTMMPMPAFAAQGQDIPVFTPTSAWAVGSTELSNVRSLRSVNLPCVISTEYDNGFVVRFSGGGRQLLAMAIDFRQNVFEPGKKYNAMLSVGDAYSKQVSATGFTASTLIFNLRPLKDFYSVVKGAGDIELDIDGNIMKFTLGQIGESYDDLESCYAGGDAKPVTPMPGAQQNASVQPLKKDDMVAQPLPQSFDEIVQKADAQSGAQERPSQILPRVSRMMDESPRMMPMAQAQWSAKAGEDMKAVLSRWSMKAGYDLQWQADQGGKVTQDIQSNGSFEDAVAQLMAQNGAASAYVKTPEGTQKDLGTSATLSPMPIVPVQATVPALRSEWSAKPGASIQQVLDQWGAKAGVAVVWQSYMNIPVRDEVKVSGSFEQAVQSLLDQYADDPERPLAQLNTDPDTGARTLTMNMGA